jgi:hypothetical protein
MADNTGITDDNVEKAETLLDKYLSEYNAIKSGGGEDKSGFLRPIAEGFNPAVTSKATSVLGMKANPAVLAAIGGLASGLSGGGASTSKTPATDSRKDLKDLMGMQKDVVGIEEGLRKELKPYKDDMISITNSTSALMSALNSPIKGVGDVQAIYNWMSALDPRSRVTDAEVRLGGETAGVWTNLKNEVANVLTNKKAVLSDEVRKEIGRLTVEVYKKRADAYTKIENSKGKLASKYGVDPANVKEESPIQNFEMDELYKKLQSIKPKKEIPETPETPKVAIRAEQSKDIEMADFILASPADFEKEQVEWAKKIKGVK